MLDCRAMMLFEDIGPPLTPNALAEKTIAEQFSARLREFTGCGINDLKQEIIAVKRTEVSIAAALRDPELRTVMILDIEGAVDSYNITNIIPARAVTIGARPDWSEYAGASKNDLITIDSTSICKGSEAQSSGAFQALCGNIDILFIYHQGTGNKDHLILADQLLSPHGHMVEIFVQPDGTDCRIPTYYSRPEVSEMARSRHPAL